MNRIALILAFAQSSDQDYLNFLSTEEQSIKDAFESVIHSGAARVITSGESNIEDLSSLILKSEKEAAIFHFGGHAGLEGLLLKDGNAYVEGLAKQLSTQPGLKVVFLNACATHQQVDPFLVQGIPIVIATTCLVTDGQAGFFARQFYQSLAQRMTIRESFDLAVGAMKMKWEVYRMTPDIDPLVVRGLKLPKSFNKASIPWKIYVREDQKDVLNWYLPYPRISTIPPMNPEEDCIGRETAISNLHAKLAESSKPVVIRGMGGSGKTTLATAYATIHASRFNHLIWIDSVDEMVSFFIVNSTLRNALEWRPMMDHESIEDYFLFCLARLKRLPGNNLVVFDKATKIGLKSLVKDRQLWELLAFPSNWKVLFTSRERLPFFEDFSLGMLNPKAAKKIFFKYYDRKEDAGLDNLLREIDFHPLTIELLSKTLGAFGGLISIEEALDKILSMDLDDIDLQDPVFTRHSKEEAGVFIHLIRTFELANLEEEAIRYLQLRALLPAEAMLIDHLSELFEEPAIRLTKRLNDLERKGWLSKQGQSFGMHRMIQEMILYQCPPREGKVISLTYLLENKLKSFPNSKPDTIYWAVNSLPLSRWLAIQPTLSTSIGFWLVGIANYLKDHIFQKNIEFIIRKSVIKAESKEQDADFALLLVFLRIHLASALQKLDKLDEAEEIARKNLIYINIQKTYALLDKFKGKADEDDIDWSFLHINISCELVTILLKKKEVYKALEINKGLLKTINRSFSSNTAVLGLSVIHLVFSDLIRVLHDLDDNKNAIELIDGILGLYPDNISYQFLKGKTLSRMKRFDEAATIFEKLMKNEELKNQQYDYTNLLEEYALLFDTSGQPQKAIPLFKEILKSKQAILVSDHQEIINTLSFIGIACYRNNQDEEGEYYLIKASEAAKGKQAIDIRVSLGILLNGAGKYEHAIDHLKVAYTLQQKTFRTDMHTEIITTLLYIGKSYLELKQLNDAREYLEKAQLLAQNSIEPYDSQISQDIHSSIENLKAKEFQQLSS